MNRRAVLSGLAMAPLAAAPAVAARPSVDDAIKSLVDALRHQHGGKWRTIIDIDAGLVSVVRRGS